MKHSIEESRGSTLAQWTNAVLLAVVPASCVSSDASNGARNRGDNATADLAVEMEALTEELVQRASLRIPLGSMRVFVDDPIAVRPDSKRYWPAHWAADEWRATQAAVEFELQFTLANRMNVVGAHRHASASASDSAIALAAHDSYDAHSRASHALLTTFVQDGIELELTVQLVECDSGWIVATARRRIVGWSPDSYAFLEDPPLPTAPIVRGTEVAPAVEQGALARVVASVDPTSVALDTTLAERSASVSPAPPTDSLVSQSDAYEVLEPVDGPAALRRRALERSATEVAARVGDGTQ